MLIRMAYHSVHLNNCFSADIPTQYPEVKSQSWKYSWMYFMFSKSLSIVISYVSIQHSIAYSMRTPLHDILFHPSYHPSQNVIDIAQTSLLSEHFHIHLPTIASSLAYITTNMPMLGILASRKHILYATVTVTKLR